MPFQSQQHALFLHQFSQQGPRPALREFEPSQTGDFPSQEDLAGSSNDEGEYRDTRRANRKRPENDKGTIQSRTGAAVAPASAFALKDELNTIQVHPTGKEESKG